VTEVEVRSSRYPVALRSIGWMLETPIERGFLNYNSSVMPWLKTPPALGRRPSQGGTNMELTREEAVALLNRWKASSSEIQVMLAADGISLGFRGRVGEISETSVQLLGSNDAEAVLSFVDASFEWTDKRETPMVTRFESILNVSLPHCDLVLAE